MKKFFCVYKDDIDYQVDTLDDNDIDSIDLSRYLWIIKGESPDSHGAVNTSYRYEVFNNKLDKTCLEINGWKAESNFYTYSCFSAKKTMVIKFMDVNRITKQVEITDTWFGGFTILLLIGRLIEYSQYYTWLIYEQSEENRDLKLKIEKLEPFKELYTQLYNENNILKEKMSNFKRVINENIILKNKMNTISNLILNQDTTISS